ncbi:sugar transferase [Jatrophihabitans sp. YIM 134969]
MTEVLPDAARVAPTTLASESQQVLAPLPVGSAPHAPWPGLKRRSPLRPWARQYGAGLLSLDLGLILLAVSAAFLLRFTALDGTGTGSVQFLAVCAVIVGVWVAALGAVGAYDARHATSGPEEFKRVIMASGITAGAVAIVCYVFRIEIARGFVAGAIPIGAALLLLGRVLSRRVVRSRRAAGEWNFRTVVAGTSDSVRHFVEVTQRNPESGMTVIGACVEDAEVGSEIAPGVPVLSGVTTIADAAAHAGADVVALAGSGLGPGLIRELGWSLEGSGRDLVMVPGLTEVAGPRLHVTPVDGLPMMWVEKPVLRGYKRILKRGFDVAVAGTMLFFLAPVFAVIGMLIKVDSKGPVFFTQTRFGKTGREFRIWKFRSMATGADKQHLSVMTEAGSEEGKLFFKVKADPRVTKVGRVLRKLSIDELPQLINVVNGTMSLVGPRPQCDHEVAAYDGATSRRLLVKPGMTGLWQVSGRSDLTPEDGVRLDLYYVENWSLAMDFAIIGRTVHTVLRGHGAY